MEDKKEYLYKEYDLDNETHVPWQHAKAMFIHDARHRVECDEEKRATFPQPVLNPNTSAEYYAKLLYTQVAKKCNMSSHPDQTPLVGDNNISLYAPTRPVQTIFVAGKERFKRLLKEAFFQATTEIDLEFVADLRNSTKAGTSQTRPNSPQPGTSRNAYQQRKDSGTAGKKTYMEQTRQTLKDINLKTNGDVSTITLYQHPGEVQKVVRYDYYDLSDKNKPTRGVLHEIKDPTGKVIGKKWKVSNLKNLHADEEDYKHIFQYQEAPEESQPGKASAKAKESKKNQPPVACTRYLSPYFMTCVVIRFKKRPSDPYRRYVVPTHRCKSLEFYKNHKEKLRCRKGPTCKGTPVNGGCGALPVKEPGYDVVFSKGKECKYTSVGMTETEYQAFRECLANKGLAGLKIGDKPGFKSPKDEKKKEDGGDKDSKDNARPAVQQSKLQGQWKNPPRMRQAADQNTSKPEDLIYYLVMPGTPEDVMPDYYTIREQPTFDYDPTDQPPYQKYECRTMTKEQKENLYRPKFPIITGVTQEDLDEIHAVPLDEVLFSSETVWDGDVATTTFFNHEDGNNSASRALDHVHDGAQARSLPKTPERKSSGSKRKAMSPLDKNNISPDSPTTPVQVPSNTPMQNAVRRQFKTPRTVRSPRDSTHHAPTTPVQARPNTAAPNSERRATEQRHEGPSHRNSTPEELLPPIMHVRRLTGRFENNPPRPPGEGHGRRRSL